jgi:hypothetical protein
MNTIQPTASNTILAIDLGKYKSVVCVLDETSGDFRLPRSIRRRKKGDVIDLWAALHGMDLRTAALDLVHTFDLEATATEKRHG